MAFRLVDYLGIVMKGPFYFENKLVEERDILRVWHAYRENYHKRRRERLHFVESKPERIELYYETWWPVKRPIKQPVYVNRDRLGLSFRDDYWPTALTGNNRFNWVEAKKIANGSWHSLVRRKAGKVASDGYVDALFDANGFEVVLCE